MKRFGYAALVVMFGLTVFTACGKQEAPKQEAPVVEQPAAPAATDAAPAAPATDAAPAAPATDAAPAPAPEHK